MNQKFLRYSLFSSRNISSGLSCTVSILQIIDFPVQGYGVHSQKLSLWPAANHQCPNIPYLIAPRLCDLILGNRIPWKWWFVYKVRDIMGHFLLFLDHLLQRKLSVTLCACIFGKKTGFHANNHLLHVHRWLIHKHIDYKLMKGSNLDSHIYTVFGLQAFRYFQALIFGSSLLHYNRLLIDLVLETSMLWEPSC